MPKYEKENHRSVDVDHAGEGHITDSDNIPNHKYIHRSGAPIMITLVVIAGILFVMAIAMFTGNVFLRDQSGFMMFGRNNNTGFIERDDGIYGGMHGGMMGLRNYTSTNATNSNIVSGVVTSVNGSNFVIAGGGNQFTVNTTGSTTYNTTDKKVTVNDSVVVIGTITDKTVAATDVRIINY